MHRLHHREILACTVLRHDSDCPRTTEAILSRFGRSRIRFHSHRRFPIGESTRRTSPSNRQRLFSLSAILSMVESLRNILSHGRSRTDTHVWIMHALEFARLPWTSFLYKHASMASRRMLSEKAPRGRMSFTLRFLNQYKYFLSIPSSHLPAEPWFSLVQFELPRRRRSRTRDLPLLNIFFPTMVCWRRERSVGLPCLLIHPNEIVFVQTERNWNLAFLLSRAYLHFPLNSDERNWSHITELELWEMDFFLDLSTNHF